MVRESIPPWSARTTAALITRSLLNRTRWGGALPLITLAGHVSLQVLQKCPLDECASYTVPWPFEVYIVHSLRKELLMGSPRKTALVAGVFFIITFVTSIPALLLYNPVLKHTGYIVGAGADRRIFLGALLEVLLIIANIGTAAGSCCSRSSSG